MGLLFPKFKPILKYYLLQKKIKENLRNENITDNNNIKKGYYLHPNFIKEWKKGIDYLSISKYLDTFNIENNKFSEKQIKCLEEYLKNNKISFQPRDSFKIKKKFIPLHKLIINEKILENLVNKNFIFKNIDFEEINYIFKQQMIIFLFDKYKIIKILIHSLSPFKKIENVINLKFIFNDKCEYDNKKLFLIENKSLNIINDLLIMNSFEEPISKNPKFILINEEKYIDDNNIQKDNFFDNSKNNNLNQININIQENQNKNYNNEIKRNGDRMSYNISKFNSNNDEFNININFKENNNNNIKRKSFNNQNHINLNKIINNNDINYGGIDSNLNFFNFNENYNAISVLELNNKIYQLENLLNEERNKNQELIIKNNNLENELQKKINIENSLNKEINELEQENNDIKLKIKENSLNQFLSGEKILALLFLSRDFKINKPIACKNTDIFVEIEDKIYSESPILKKRNKIYLVNGEKIEPNLSIEKNNIKDGNTILIEFLD